MSSIRLLALASLVPFHLAVAQSPAAKWAPAPAIFPAGAKMAIMQGDPSKPGLFTIRLDMPGGYRISPHFHPTDENVTVISGTFLIGMGDKIDAKHTMILKAGEFAKAPAQQHHYAIARGHTIVQVHAIGPFQLTYVNPSDDPTRKSSPVR